MCGIAGYVCTEKYEPKLDVAFPLMGVFMEERGNQSWGYTDGQRIHKAVRELQEGWTPDMTGALQAALHTRHATKGAITSENSHPWDFGDGFIAMHNGVIDNYDEVNKAYGYEYPVDSQTLLRHIKEGRDLSEIEGYGAVVFWRGGKVWLGTFRGGDLAIAQTEFGVVFASRPWAIDNALSMAGLPKAMHYQVDDGKLYYIEGGQLFISDEKLNVAERKKTTTWQSGNVTSMVELEKKYGVGASAIDDLHVNYSAAACDWCNRKGADLFDTPEGPLCEQCARFAMGNASTYEPKQIGTSVVAMRGPAEACCERNSFDIPCDCDKGTSRYELIDDEDFTLFTEMTVRDWCQLRDSDETNDQDFPYMTSCDECSETLTADDTVFVDEGTAVDIVLCDRCHDKKLAVDQRQEEISFQN